MRNFGQRTAHLGGVLAHDHFVHLVQPEPDENLALACRAADRRTDLLDRDGFFLGHLNYSTIAAASASASTTLAPPRPRRSAIFLPRRCATDLGEDWLVSASKVARKIGRASCRERV